MLQALPITAHCTVWWISIPSVWKPVSSRSWVVNCTSRTEVATTARPMKRTANHLVLIARDNTGYRNLLQLVTLSHLEGFHYRPRVDKELLNKYRQGLICMSGCASAEVPTLLADGNYDAAREMVGWYRELFGENYFLELQRHEHVPQLPRINDGLIRLNQDTGIPLVVTNDAHYVRQTDHQYQDVYICIQTGTNIHDEKRLRMEDSSYYIKSPQEMAADFPEFPRRAGRYRRDCATVRCLPGVPGRCICHVIPLPTMKTPTPTWKGCAGKDSSNVTGATIRRRKHAWSTSWKW